MDIHPTISPNLCKKNIQKFHQHPSFYFHSKKKLKKGMGRRSNPKSCTNSLHSWKASKIFAMEILFLFYIFKFEFIASQHVTTRHGLIKINFTSTSLKLWSLKLCTNKEFWQTLIINRWCTLFTGLHNFHSTNCTNLPLFEGFPLHECHTGHPLMELLILWTMKRCQRIKL